MNISDPSIIMQRHLATLPTSDSSIMSTALVSDRLGDENMDGHAILASQPKSYARPWKGCIPLEQLTRDNIPPFYVRLQDDQVGHLIYWASSSRNSITRLKLGQFWPWDFDTQGRLLSRRDSWGAEYDGAGKERGCGLGGGKRVPTWTDPGLPLTYTSSHRVMARELDALKRNAALKRKAEEAAGRNACMPVKKPRLSSMATELKKMRETAETKRQATDKEKERYAGGKPELRDAMQVVDTLMRSATETGNQNATLEALLLKNEARYIKDTDAMFDEWLAYNEIKRTEVDRMLENHATEVKTRDTKIEALEAEAQGSRARLDKEKRKVQVRDARLAKVKSRWAQEQALMENRLREIEELAVDVDQLSELNYDSDDWDDEESVFASEQEEAEAEAKGGLKAEQKKEEEQEIKERLKQEPNEAPGDEAAKQPEANGPTDRELRRSIVRETTIGISAKDFGDLDEDEDEDDEGPISSRQKRKSR